MKEIEEKQKQKEVTQTSMTEQPNPQEQKVHSLLWPFAGPKGTTIAKNLNKTLKNELPSNVKTRISYTGQKLNSRFQIKDKINERKTETRSNLLYKMPGSILHRRIFRWNSSQDYRTSYCWKRQVVISVETCLITKSSTRWLK